MVSESIQLLLASSQAVTLAHLTAQILSKSDYDSEGGVRLHSNRLLGDRADLGTSYGEEKLQGLPRLADSLLFFSSSQQGHFVSRPSCLLLHQRQRCLNLLRQGVRILVTSPEPGGIIHLNYVLNALGGCWARNGNSSKHYLGNRKPNIFFQSLFFSESETAYFPMKYNLWIAR